MTILLLALGAAHADGCYDDDSGASDAWIDSRIRDAEGLPTDLILDFHAGSQDQAVLTDPDGNAIVGSGRPFVPDEPLAPFTSYTFSVLDLDDTLLAAVSFTTGAGPTEVTEPPELVSFGFVGKTEYTTGGSCGSLESVHRGWAFEGEMVVGDADVLSTATISIAERTTKDLREGEALVYDYRGDPDPVEPGADLRFEGTLIEKRELCIAALVVDASGRSHESDVQCASPSGVGCSTVPVRGASVGMVAGLLAARRRRRA